MTFEVDARRALSRAGQWANNAASMTLVAMSNVDPEYPESTFMEMDAIAEKLEKGARFMRDKIAVMRSEQENTPTPKEQSK